MSMNIEMFIVKSTSWQLASAVNYATICIANFIFTRKARPEFQESVVLSVVKFSSITYSGGGRIPLKVGVRHSQQVFVYLSQQIP